MLEEAWCKPLCIHIHTHAHTYTDSLMYTSGRAGLKRMDLQKALEVYTSPMCGLFVGFDRFVLFLPPVSVGLTCRGSVCSAMHQDLWNIPDTAISAVCELHAGLDPARPGSKDASKHFLFFSPQSTSHPFFSLPPLFFLYLVRCKWGSANKLFFKCNIWLKIKPSCGWLKGFGVKKKWIIWVMSVT